MVRRKRAGRKRKPAVPRHPGGQIVQQPKATKERDMRSVVVEARQRVYGLAEDEAKRMDESTTIGHLAALGGPDRRTGKDPGGITALQLGAAVEYRNAERAYALAMGVTHKVGALARMAAENPDEYTGRQPQRRHSVDLQDEEAYADWCRLAIRRHDVYQLALRTCGDRYALSTVDFVVLADMPVPAFIGSLRRGLDAIAKAVRLAGAEPAAA